MIALFGGAITSRLDNFVDVSQIRQVPDNIEAFAHVSNNDSLIIELLEPVDHTGQALARYHFEELARHDGAATCTVSQLVTLAVPNIQDVQEAYLLVGQQTVSKFNTASLDVVDMYLAVIRLNQAQTDMLVLYNHPHDMDGGAFDTFMTFVRSLAIQDYSLFNE
jgi:hypothetical protein